MKSNSPLTAQRQKRFPGLPFVAILLSFATCASAIAHGDLHEQIAIATAKLQHQPTNVDLLLHRAEIYRLHGDIALALQDCTDVAKRGNATQQLISDVIRGKALFDGGRFSESVKALGAPVAAGHTEALLTRARAFAKLSRWQNAAGDYSQLVRIANPPLPDYYTEWADALKRASQPGDAVAALDQGIRQLGAIASLELPAIELDRQQEQWQPALERVERLAAPSARKERWLALRADILRQAGRTAEARKCYANAKEAIAHLPTRYREHPQVKDLALAIDRSLAELETQVQ